MNVAVLSLTRDRLAYTQHCFGTLEENAGCEYDHYIYDQDSTDGTPEWLMESYYFWSASAENLGISRALNEMLPDILECGAEYDVIVKYDNDCELLQPNTLRTVCELALEGDCLLSPRILGLRNPPPVTGEFMIGDEVILDVPQIGGIFLAAPAWVYDEFRYSEANPLWGGDDVEICGWFRGQGGRCGYVKRFAANHYETTDGQQARYPEYFSRKFAEMGLT